MKSFIRGMIVIFCIGFVILPISMVSYTGAGAGESRIEINLIVSSADLKLVSFRRDTALSMEEAINDWLKNHSNVYIVSVQSFSTIFGTRIMYIWYKKEK